jgi:SSS family solute:Na+ symporter
MIWNRFHSFIAVVYLAALLAIGVLARRKRGDSNQFLNATGSLPLWVCVAACISANCGSLDVIAMMALGAQYGMVACHFYWIGAVPALILLAFWLLPAYARERYPSVLDFIGRCYGERTRSLVALCMAAMMLMLAGVCLCAAAQTLTTFFGWSFGAGVVVTAAVVMFYTWMGGLRATVYTELLHFAVVLCAVTPLYFLVVRDFGGVAALLARVPEEHRHVWQGLPMFDTHAPMDAIGVIFGLGLVLSFGYWSTDFVQMQRALAVKNAASVPAVPLSMAAAKIVFSFLIVIPGVAAPLILSGSPAQGWNTTLPSLMMHYFPPAWVAVGILGLSASLVSTFANNVSGFSAAWIQGVYQVWMRPRASEEHYLRMGRLTSLSAVLLSIGAAYAALTYQSLMEFIQLILSTFNAPLFALVLAGAAAPRRAARGGTAGLLAGLASAGAHQVMVRAGALHYGSRMSANFYAAMLSFSVTLAATLLASRWTRAREGCANEPVNLRGRASALTLLGAALVGGACLVLNILLR